MSCSPGDQMHETWKSAEWHGLRSEIQEVESFPSNTALGVLGINSGIHDEDSCICPLLSDESLAFPCPLQQEQAIKPWTSLGDAVFPVSRSI